MKVFLKVLVVTIIIFLVILSAFRYIIVPYIIKEHKTAVDFKNLKLPRSPNFYYLKPNDYIFPGPVHQLKEQWEKMINKKNRVHKIIADSATDQYVYVQLSAFWHFPDFIDIKFIPINEQKSTVAVFSRSYFGYYDFHVNQKRVINWIDAIK